MGSTKRLIWILLTICLVFTLTACNLSGKDIAQTPTSTQLTANATETLQPTATPTATETSTSTPIPTVTPTVTPTSVLDLYDFEPDPATEAWQSTVNGFRDFVRAQNLPDEFMDYYREWMPDSEPPVTKGLFDPNQLLYFLPHLHLKPGYALDYVYYWDGGFPILYARPTTVPHFETIDEYMDYAGESDFSTILNAFDYLSYVETDGSEKGYFEFFILRVMGGQFYLFWDANYNDWEIVASKERLIEMVDEIGSDGFGRPFTNEEKHDVLEINPAPVVIITEDSVIVRYIVFSKWRGFSEVFFELSPTPPYEFQFIESHNIVPYECGVDF